MDETRIATDSEAPNEKDLRVQEEEREFRHQIENPYRKGHPWDWPEDKTMGQDQE